MQRIIIIKYGELSTKKDNINFFLSTLKDNIKAALAGYNVRITYDKGRMFIQSQDDNYENILKKVQNIFGIHEINLGYELDTTDLETIANSLNELLANYDFTTFKVVTKRSDKTYPLDSMEISRRLGASILKHKDNIRVDVHQPELFINVEIRLGHSYLYFAKVPGLGGYPVGSLGKGMLMLSGGIDSPVAGYLALKRGVRIEAVYFESPPHTSLAAKNKVISLARNLANYAEYVKLHVINFTEIQESILRLCPRDYLITIMRRMMYRIAEQLAYKNNCKVIINGESIGQVASQTLASMSAINAVTKMPVIRPVACLDKLEIIQIAKQIETYDISIQPYEDCCTIFVPEHPVINPVTLLCEDYEQAFDFASLIEKAIENEEIIKVTNQMNEEHADIL